MDALRTRYAEAKQADVARNTLLDDLFQKVDDMQKTMDRNAFVMVLIDGDCMNVSPTTRRSTRGYTAIVDEANDRHQVPKRAGQRRSFRWG